MKKKILRLNKKGAISGIASGIGDIIKTAFDTFPKPLKFIFFLLIILLLGGIINFSLNLFGVYCDSADQPVNLGLNIFTNIGLISQVPNANEINLAGRSAEEWGYSMLSQEVTKCSKQIRTGGTIIYDTGNEENINNNTWFYDGGFCTNCELVTIYDNVGNSHRYCLGDVFRQSRDDLSWLKKQLCGSWISCEPPEHYYYDQTVNRYVCEDETCTDQTIGTAWDELLQEKGATYLYPEGSNTKRKHTNFVGVTCEDIRPKITIYGINVFNYTYWVIIMLIILCFWFYSKYKKK